MGRKGLYGDVKAGRLYEDECEWRKKSREQKYRCFVTGIEWEGVWGYNF